MADAGWRGYLFANLGNLTTWDTPLSQYARDTRTSVGVAAAWNFMGERAGLDVLSSNAASDPFTVRSFLLVTF